jgi:hypothetical protein
MPVLPAYYMHKYHFFPAKNKKYHFFIDMFVCNNIMFSVSFFYASVQLGAGNTMHMNEKTRFFLANLIYVRPEPYNAS